MDWKDGSVVRARATFSEYQGSIPSTHLTTQNCNCSPRGFYVLLSPLMPSSDLQEHQAFRWRTHVRTHARMHARKTFKHIK